MSEVSTDFYLLNFFGNGAFGKVLKATHIRTGHKVAIKIILKRNFRTN